MKLSNMWEGFRQMFLLNAHGKMSNTKLFANLGYVIVLVMFPYAVLHGSQVNAELWMVFGGITIGNRFVNYWVEVRNKLPK